MSEPFYFDQLNQYESHIVPGTLKPADSALSAYYRRWLANRAFAIFDFKGAPESWNIEFVKWNLITWGVCAVLNTDKFGVIPQRCGFSGYDVFYRPTRALVVNPLFDKTYDLRIGIDCELIRLSPDWRGIPDLIGHYADMLALTATSEITNLYNTRLAYVFSASTKAMAESFKAMFDKISDGNAAVFMDKQLFREDGSPNWLPFQQDLASVFLVDKLQAAERTYLNDFYCHIGIPNIPYEKNERLNMEESSVNDYATLCLVALWKRTISECLDKVNKMFGLSISVDYNEDLLREVKQNGNGSDSQPGGDDEIPSGSAG